MATTTSSQQHASRLRPGAHGAGQPLTVSAYERVSSLMVALLVMVGLAALFLLIIWFTNRIASTQQAVPVILENLGGGREDGVVGESLQIDAPPAEQIAEETDLEEPELEQTMAMITEAVATRLVDLDDPLLAEENVSGPAGGSQGTGNAPAFGAGEGDNPGIPRHQRWRILFSQRTVEEYAKQLDYFNIELAALGSGRIEYANNLSAGRPVKRTNITGKGEQRLSMSWRSGTLREFDLKLLAKAGVKTENRIILQFYPAEAENLLALLEKQYKGLDADRIRRTTFGIKAAGGGYEFYVVEQEPL